MVIVSNPGSSGPPAAAVRCSWAMGTGKFTDLLLGVAVRWTGVPSRGE